MKNLIQDIKQKSFQRVYLIYGEESFLKKSYKHQMKAAINGDDTMNYSYFEGKGLDVNEIISLAETMPFFAERRLIVLEDTGFFKSSPDEMVKYMPQIPSVCTLMFVESEVDKRSRMYKKVKELGAIAEMNRQSSAQLMQWAAGLLGRENKVISRRCLELFLSYTGDDMEHIRTELDKLVSYVGNREDITEQDVQAVTTVQVTNKIFDMVSAIVSRQPRKALDLYEDLLILKEPPMRILFLIARQFNQLLQVKEMEGQGFDKAAIASRLKMQPFVVGKLMPQARSFKKESILEYVSLCVETEEAVKQGRLQDRLAVELLIAGEY